MLFGKLFIVTVISFLVVCDLYVLNFAFILVG